MQFLIRKSKKSKPSEESTEHNLIKEKENTAHYHMFLQLNLSLYHSFFQTLFYEEISPISILFLAYRNIFYLSLSIVELFFQILFLALLKNMNLQYVFLKFFEIPFNFSNSSFLEAFLSRVLNFIISFFKNQF